MKLKGTRATYAACVLCAVFMPVMLAPVNEPKQLDPSLSPAIFSNSANMELSASANPSASWDADKPLQNITDNQQPPGNSAPTVIGPSAADDPPAEKPLSTVAVKKDLENIVSTVAQETVVGKSVPPGNQSQSPDPEASAKKDNADQGQGPPPPPPPSPSPRESETEKKEAEEAADPSARAPQMLASGTTEAQGGEGKEVNPPPILSESAVIDGAKPEDTQASQISNPEVPQETETKANQTQGSVVIDEQAQEAQQTADLAQEAQPSAAPSAIAQSPPVEPPKLPEQTAAETQEPKPVNEEMQKPEVSEVEAPVPKEPEQQAENTQDSDALVEQPKEQEQNANETQEQPEQPAVDEEAKGTDTEDNLIEENINNDEEIREQYENEIPVVEKPVNDYSYTMDSSQQSAMATDMQANNPSFNDELVEDSQDDREVIISNGGKFTDDEDSHFFAYFLTIMVSAIIFYLVFHNKQRIIALIIEGRSPGERRGRRSSSRGKYHKLDNNLEEAITATKGAKRH
ncbi:trans-Golgi network integral membrane protein 2-like [Penaeus chinensis]|uniref:trans-Golgi network integral membrane protein 2-like n=1 Tax=Penaeus chinensis TaxID=139456 RepID=UPI001FB70168|nr:trans-Golgi network integral membrane protein 2-like [Penaeus chinensis]